MFLVPVFVPLCFVSASWNQLTQSRDNWRSQGETFVVMMIFCKRFLSLMAPEHFSSVCPMLKLDIKRLIEQKRLDARCHSFSCALVAVAARN